MMVVDNDTQVSELGPSGPSSLFKCISSVCLLWDGANAKKFCEWVWVVSGYSELHCFGEKMDDDDGISPYTVL